MIKTKRMVLGFVILFICVFMTTGCFKEETHTARGAKWYVEETAPTNKYVANVGDMYLDKETNNLYQMKEDGWLQVGNLSSKETPITPTNENQNGKKPPNQASAKHERPRPSPNTQNANLLSAPPPPVPPLHSIQHHRHHPPHRPSERSD